MRVSTLFLFTTHVLTCLKAKKMNTKLKPIILLTALLFINTIFSSDSLIKCSVTDTSTNKTRIIPTTKKTSATQILPVKTLKLNKTTFSSELILGDSFEPQKYFKVIINNNSHTVYNFSKGLLLAISLAKEKLFLQCVIK